MRRTLIAVFLVFAATMPVCAQRFGSAPRGGGAGFARGQHSFGGGRAVATPHYQSGFRGGIAFGHHPRWIVTTSWGSHWGYGSQWHWGYRSHHRHYWSSYVYPYFYAGFYSPYYDNFDYYGSYGSYEGYAPVVTTPAPEVYVVAAPQPYYPYYPDQQVGLDTQMRQQQVGIYRPPVQPESTPEAQPAPSTAPPPAEQPPTVLVYRDGRRSEVRNYAIVGQTLWIFTEQRAQKVPLSEIDIAATQRANADHGVEFTVPAPK